MAFSDPQTVTVNSVAQSMARVITNGSQSIYSKADGAYKMTISHTTSKDRVRSMVRVDQRAIVPDPLTAVNDYENLGVYLVIDRPEVGFDATTVYNLIAGLKTWLDSTASGKIFGKET